MKQAITSCAKILQFYTRLAITKYPNYKFPYWVLLTSKRPKGFDNFAKKDTNETQKGSDENSNQSKEYKNKPYSGFKVFFLLATPALALLLLGTRKPRKVYKKKEIIELLKEGKLGSLISKETNNGTLITVKDINNNYLGTYLTKDLAKFNKDVIGVQEEVKKEKIIEVTPYKIDQSTLIFMLSVNLLLIALFLCAHHTLRTRMMKLSGINSMRGSITPSYMNTVKSKPKQEKVTLKDNIKQKEAQTKQKDTAKDNKKEESKEEAKKENDDKESTEDEINPIKKSLDGVKKIYEDMFGVVNSKAKEFGDKIRVNISFKDVAGMEGPKEEIKEFVEFLKNPLKFQELGAKIPKGALLTGPPGTGKTLLAKACAGEAGVPFFVTSGSEFVEMYVGVGAARVRDLFEKAKAKSPAIIFIDEIDAIGRKRDMRGFDSERENTLNQIFVELDGFGTNENVIVFAATNRKDILDKALIRPGRFDRIIEVNLPTRKEREEIFMVHLRNIEVTDGITKESIASKLSALSMGMSGAEIYSICNEAAILAARRNKISVDMDDFYEAYDRVLTGLKRKLPITPEEKKVIAFHEAGHAIVAWFLKYAQPVLKVFDQIKSQISIIPRSKGSFGHTILMSNEIELYKREQVEDMICELYGGRVAEELFIGSTTTGAQDDLQKATGLAKKYVGLFGMSKEFGTIAGLNYSNPMLGVRKSLYSNDTSWKFDRVVQDICKQQSERAIQLLKSKAKEVKLLAEMLLKKETLELDDLTELLGKPENHDQEDLTEYKKDLKKRKELETEKTRVNIILDSENDNQNKNNIN